MVAKAERGGVRTFLNIGSGEEVGEEILKMLIIEAFVDRFR